MYNMPGLQNPDAKAFSPISLPTAPVFLKERIVPTKLPGPATHSTPLPYHIGDRPQIDELTRILSQLSGATGGTSNPDKIAPLEGSLPQNPMRQLDNLLESVQVSPESLPPANLNNTQEFYNAIKQKLTQQELIQLNAIEKSMEANPAAFMGNVNKFIQSSQNPAISPSEKKQAQTILNSLENKMKLPEAEKAKETTKSKVKEELGLLGGITKKLGLFLTAILGFLIYRGFKLSGSESGSGVSSPLAMPAG